MRRRTKRPLCRRGYSLLELLIAIILIDAGLLAIVQTHAIVVRRRNEIHARAVAVAAAASRVEQLVAAPCAATSGSAAARGYDETWFVRPGGRAREISDSLAFGAGATHRLTLRTKLAC